MMYKVIKLDLSNINNGPINNGAPNVFITLNLVSLEVFIFKKD